MLLPDEKLKPLLLQAGINEKTIDELSSFAKSARIPLQSAVVEKDILSDEMLGLIIADYFKFPFVVLSKITIPEDVFRITPERIARKYKILSFAKDNESIKLAMADPKNTAISEMIVKKTGLKVTPYFATETDIENTLQIFTLSLRKKSRLFVSELMEFFMMSCI